MASCTCPLPASLADLPVVDCKEFFGQIQRTAFQRIGTGSEFLDASNNINLLASWTAFRAAADDTKTIVSYFFENFVIPTAEPVTEGGNDNTTLNGEQIINGKGFISATGRYRNVPNAYLTSLKALECEAAIVNRIGVYLLNEFGQIIAKRNVADTGYVPIPITNLFVPDAGSGGKNGADFSNFSFNLKDGWREGIALIDPTDFNPLDTTQFLP